MIVCAVDGVELVEARGDRLLHAGSLPPETPEHDPEPVEWDALMAKRAARSELVLAVEDMLVHHATLHPHKDCQWAEALQRALAGA